MQVNQLTPTQLKAKLEANENLFLLDVREPQEFAYAKIDGSILIPLNEIPARLSEIDMNKEIVAICHHGIRSMQTAYFLSRAGFNNISNLAGGIDRWSLECDSAVKRY